VDNVTPVSSITFQERRSADGLDTHVPMILQTDWMHAQQPQAEEMAA